MTKRLEKESKKETEMEKKYTTEKILAKRQVTTDEKAMKTTDKNESKTTFRLSRHPSPNWTSIKAASIGYDAFSTSLKKKTKSHVSTAQHDKSRTHSVTTKQKRKSTMRQNKDLDYGNIKGNSFDEISTE